MVDSLRSEGLLLRTVVLAAAAVLSVAALVFVFMERATPVVAGAEAVDQDDHPSVLDDDGRFTGPGEVWPPQPRNATEIVERDFGDLEAEAPQARLARVESKAGRSLDQNLNPDLDQAADAEGLAGALGERHNLIAVDEDGDTAQIIYYSLSNNQTVDIIMVDGVVSSLTTYPADEWQPELSDVEKQAAVDVARAFWQRQRDDRIDSLVGFSILAFQPGGAYYDTRMVYVSFHASQDARPELLTWVDLAAGEVLNGEVER